MSQKDSEGVRRSERNKKGLTGIRSPVGSKPSGKRVLEFGNEATLSTLSGEETSPLITPPETSIPMANRNITRLKYRKFKGDGREDVDDWLCEFNSTAAANQEEVATKLRIFQGLLKGEALQWYQDVPEPVRNDWEQLTTTFLRTFREVGGEARILGRLSKMRMKPNESVRRYGQRVRSLIHKLTPEIAANVQIEWYVAGFPEDMGFQVRQARPQTLQDAMEAAQNYENSKQSLRQARRSSKTESSKRGKKIRISRRNESSGSGDSSSRSSTDESSSDESDSEDHSPPRRSSSSKGYRKDRDRVVVKVKEEFPDDRRIIKDIQSSLSAIKIQLADKNKPRRAIPVIRNNVWCSRCGRHGHYSHECTYTPPGTVQYVGEDGVTYFVEPEHEEVGDPEAVPVYQVMPNFGRGRGQPPMVTPRYVPANAPPSGQATGEQIGAPRRPVSFERQYGLCFNCGLPGHFAPDCPYKGGQGAPLELPCQNCGHYGHTAPQCQQPAKPRVVYKQVEVPPREQTALNYGHKEGVENPKN